MELINQDLMYVFRSKNIDHTDSLKNLANSAVRKIKSSFGWDTEVEVSIEPEMQDGQLFTVSVSVYGVGDPVVVRKHGKNLFSIFKKVNKTVLKQLQRQARKQLSFRRNSIFTEKYAW